MSAYDLFLDRCIDAYYEDAEDEVVLDDEWMIDAKIEQDLENFDE